MRLLTFLGTSRYEEVPYRLHGQECRTRLCPIAIATIAKADEIVVFVTAEARELWYDELRRGAEKLGAACRAVSIELPADEAGMWALFRAVQSEICGTSVALDVTHAFRAIPMVAMAVAGFARATDPQALKAVYYGAYEARDAEGVTPIIELTSLVSVLDWTSAVGGFQRYGDASAMARLVEEDLRPLGAEGKIEAATALRQVAGRLEAASANLLACRPRSVPEAARRAIAAIGDHAAATEAQVPAFHAVRDMLLEALGGLTVSSETRSNRAQLEAQLAMIRWYAGHRHPLHALALSREWIVTLACMLNHLDWTSREKRSEVEALIHDHAVPRQLADSFDRVSQWRNDVLHCGMRESSMPAETVLKNAKGLDKVLLPLLDLMPVDNP